MVISQHLTVRSMTVEAEGVLGVELVDPAGGALPDWEPGAHVDLVLGAGLVRQYSLCGDPADRDRLRLGVLRASDSRGGSSYVHTRLRPGDRVEVRGPRNHFRLVDAPRYVFIAGGIGVTPLLPMIAAAAAAGADWRLSYGGRNLASMAFRAPLAAYGDRVGLHPQDTHGLLDLDAILGEPRSDTRVYCCGPEPLLAAVERHCAPWPPGTLRTERFAAPAAPPPAVDENAVELVLAASGRTIAVPPGQSLLDALLGAGVSVLTDCREGICGSCETKVLDGEVDHRDHVLTERERRANTCLMVCVSRARGGRLVLEL